MRSAAVPCAALFFCAAALPDSVTVVIDRQRVLNTFDPSVALGAAIDGHEKGEVAKMLSPANVKAMLSAGLKPVSYRLRTELGQEAWHWSPEGDWSEAPRKQGYWISRAPRAGGIQLSYGYRLPRRGSTIDQANNDGYSRLNDGNERTFWKSNPYLDRHFTGEDNRAHPQWAAIDFETATPIDAIRIVWGVPFATAFRVEYATAKRFDDVADTRQAWQPFPTGMVQGGLGGNQLLRLSPAPVRARFVRIWMTASSGPGAQAPRDVRDGLGYAIREIYAGTLQRDGDLYDEIEHAPNHDRQTVMWVSSTDPWHRAVDLDPRIEQPGFDRILRSGLLRGLPALMAAPLLYDVPENAAAELRYLRTRFPLSGMELGEEPDGQKASPEDYAALFAQWSRALAREGPEPLGGPSFAMVDPDYAPWMGRFLDHLQLHGALDRFRFFSFEWYPIDEVCQTSEVELRDAPLLLRRPLDLLRRDPRMRDLPFVITEYGYSAVGARQEVDLDGALMNADIVGAFLLAGGRQTFLYGYEPNELIREERCAWGNNMLFAMGDRGQIEYRTATYWAARLLTEHWALAAGPHRLVATETGDPLVTAYTLLRPDGRTAVLVLNKDPNRPKDLAFPGLTGPAELYRFSRQQYEWHDAGSGGYPSRSLPPEYSTLGAGPLALEVPPYSLSVLITGLPSAGGSGSPNGPATPPLPYR